MDLKALFLTADGRIGQKDFWVGFLILLGAGVVAGFLPIIGPLLHIALLFPWFCLYAKRLHDFGKPAWLVLLPFLVFVAAGLVGMMAGGGAIVAAAMRGESDLFAGGAVLAGLGVAIGLFCLASLFWLGFLLWVGLNRGTPGPNAFGPEPVSLTDGGTAAPPPATPVA